MWERFPLSFLYTSKLLNLIAMNNNFNLNKAIKDKIDFNIDEHFHNIVNRKDIKIPDFKGNFLLEILKNSRQLNLLLNNTLKLTTYYTTIDSNKIISNLNNELISID